MTMEQDNFNVYDNIIKKEIQSLHSSRKQIENFSDEQKKVIYDFLALELVKKEAKLKEFQKSIINNKIKNTNDINRLLDSLSEKEKLEFLDFLNGKK